jgi:hypothetical protein
MKDFSNQMITKFQNNSIYKISIAIGLSLSLAVGIVSCAKPKYQPAENTADEQKTGNDSGDVKKPEDGTKPSPPLGCVLRFNNLKLCGFVMWSKKPTKSGEEGSLVLKFFEEKDSPEVLTPEGDVKLILWMTAMGHGSRPTVVEQQPDKSYKISKIIFIMEGEWALKFQVLRSGKVIDQAEIQVQVQ